MKVLMLGGYGAVGRQLATELREYGDVAVLAGRDVARAEALVDLREPDLRSYRLALSGVDAVINASGVEDPGIAALATEHGAAFVDVTATTLVVKSDNAQGCVRSFVIRDEQKVLPVKGETRIDLGVLQPGRLDYACGMGMYTGHLTIV